MDAVPPLIRLLWISLASVLIGQARGATEEADSRLLESTKPAALAQTNPGLETGQAPRGVYVVPIEGAIQSPQLYILRRALREAMNNGVEVVLLDMDTPGGELSITLEMMEALDHFSGETLTFVNDEAMSAGSYIAIATDDIYFAPKGIMGAAETVTGQGQDVNDSMQRKLNSYLRAKVRTLSQTHRYRADVQRAMMDPDYVLEVEGVPLKAKGELLSLTADEAAATYGKPPEPLLASGIADSIEALLNQKYGEGTYTLRAFKVTWSEEFAKWFQGIAPLLLGAGFLLIFIEMKTPSFGLVGGLGIALLLLFFASHYFAGMAGNEPLLFFIAGIVLVAVEVFLFPGVIVVALIGGVMILSSLLWAMADIWPTPDFKVTPDLFYLPILQLSVGFVIAGIGMAVLSHLLPRSSLGRHFILGATLGKDSRTAKREGEGNPTSGGTPMPTPEPGSRGITITDLRPSGLVTIKGHQYEAKVLHGFLKQGESVEVTAQEDFAIVVQKNSSPQE